MHIQVKFHLSGRRFSLVSIKSSPKQFTNKHVKHIIMHLLFLLCSCILNHKSKKGRNIRSLHIIHNIYSLINFYMKWVCLSLILDGENKIQRNILQVELVSNNCDSPVLKSDLSQRMFPKGLGKWVDHLYNRPGHQ